MSETVDENSMTYSTQSASQLPTLRLRNMAPIFTKKI